MESELNTIIYVEMDIQRRAIAVGFPKYQIQCTNNPPVSGGYSHGITLEQLERWIWEEHRELFPSVFNTGEEVDEWESFVIDYRSKRFPDPFSARLAGVERVIEILEQQSKRKEQP